MSAKRLTKAQVLAEIAEYSELDKKSVGRVFDGLTGVYQEGSSASRTASL